MATERTALLPKTESQSWTNWLSNGWKRFTGELNLTAEQLIQHAPATFSPSQKEEFVREFRYMYSFDGWQTESVRRVVGNIDGTKRNLGLNRQTLDIMIKEVAQRVELTVTEARHFSNFHGPSSGRAVGKF